MKIACDEAGHTGPDLLAKDQRYFSYASVAIDDDEAYDLIKAARREHPVQMPELKGAQLMKSAAGQRLISYVFQAIEGRFAVNAHDKLLALCGWIFEYVYEPVIQDDPTIFYQKNLHRFVAMFAYLWCQDARSDAAKVVEQFQRYMRSKDISDAPLLFDRDFPSLDEEQDRHPFELILKFASGYKELIKTDNANLPQVLDDKGKWVLDLNASALWSHLNHWGRKNAPLDVRCDVSKPLAAVVNKFTGDESDPAIKRARLMGITDALGWELQRPIEFVDSRDHPAVQIADLVASTVISICTRGVPAGFDEAVSIIENGTLSDSIFPDYEVVDLEKRQPAVNYLVLFDLAKRAEADLDPIAMIEELYAAAEFTWAQGAFEGPE
jgi:hypothetical protein